jgi:phage head maturation protease
VAKPKDLEKVKLMERTGMTRQGVERRMKEGQASESFQQSRERKEKATADLREEQAVKARLERELLEGSVMTKQAVRDSTRRIAAILSAEMNSFRNNAPGKLAGLDEVGVRTVLDAEMDSLIERIHHQLDQV